MIDEQKPIKAGDTATSLPEDRVVPKFSTSLGTRTTSRKLIMVIVAVVALVALTVIGLLFMRSNQSVSTQQAITETKTDADSVNEVRLTPEAMAAAGIEIQGVTQRPAVSLLKVTGTVEPNQQQTQQVTPLVSGRVERVNVTLGDRVRAGSVIALISSPEIAEMHGKLREAQTRLRLAERNLARVKQTENRSAILQAKAKLDEAEATLKRTKRLIELGVGAGKDLVAAEAAFKTAKAEYDFQSNISLNRELQEASAEVETARIDADHIKQSLVTFGHAVGEEDNHESNISLVTVRAPVSGNVTERLVNAGAGVQPGTAMFTIANLSTVWVIANVPEAQVGSIHTGTTAEIRSTALGQNAVSGRVSYVDPKLSEDTRTARVRVELPNTGERLKAGMFVEVGFETSTASGPGEELVVHSDAVQRVSDRSVVFIPKENQAGVFEVRDVELGGEQDGYHRVINGLKLGDKVVTKGSFALKTQLMKGSLGEGE